MSAIIYTDGSFNSKTKRSGWGAVVECDEWTFGRTKLGVAKRYIAHLADEVPHSTNQEMELLAIHQGLEYLVARLIDRNDGGGPIQTMLYTDSQYAMQCCGKLAKADGKTFVDFALRTARGGGARDLHVDGWVANWIRNGWQTAKREKVKHRELIEGILEYITAILRAGGTVKFVWVEGHTGVAGNEIADKLAKGIF
jgi:ribonuclease HI